MKKILYTLATVALVFAVASSCSKAESAASTPEKKQQYEADINAGEQPQSNAEIAEATDQSGIATMDERAAVAVLENDNSIRPESKVTRLTFLDFNATWCGPCKQFAPVFEQAAEVYGNKADFYSVDIDKNPQTATAFEIEAVPTVIMMKPDGTIRTFIGTDDLLPASKFEALIKANL